MTCSWLVHYFFLTWTSSWLVHNLFTTCLWLVNNLFTTCSWLAHYLFRTWSSVAYDIFMTFSWLIHALFITCSYLFTTCCQAQPIASNHSCLGKCFSYNSWEICHPVSSVSWRLCPKHARGLLIGGEYFETSRSLLSSDALSWHHAEVERNAPGVCTRGRGGCSSLFRDQEGVKTIPAYAWEESGF